MRDTWLRQGRDGWEEECAHLRSMWTQRLRGVQAEVDVWQSLLAVHTLVIPPAGNADSWLKLAAHCRRAGKYSMCYKAITKLLEGLPEDTGLLPLSPAVDPKITLAWIKYLWATDQRKQAMAALHDIHTCMHACMHAYIHIYMHACMHACILCIHAYFAYMHTYTLDGSRRWRPCT